VAVPRHRVVVILVALLGAEPAHAAPSAYVDARLLNYKARQEFNLGHFREAAALYEKAYRAQPIAEFLYNLAQCYKRLPTLADHERALFHLEGYLRAMKEGDATAEVKQELADLRAQIDKERAAQRGPRKSGKLSPAAVSTNATASPVLHARVPSTPAHPRPFYKRWWFWTAVGVVVAGAAAVVAATRPGEASPITGTLPPGEATIP